MIRGSARIDDSILSPGDIGLALGTDSCDDTLDQSALESIGGTTSLFDALEEPPRHLAERIGERLDSAGACGGICHAMEIRFLDENGLCVAGDAAGERIWRAERRTERQHRHRVGAADSSG